MGIRSSKGERYTPYAGYAMSNVLLTYHVLFSHADIFRRHAIPNPLTSTHEASKRFLADINAIIERVSA